MTLEPGDMLYLPPGWGHEGTAIGACQTYSIGFRAPTGVELSIAFLDYLHERGFADIAYGDSDRRPALHPARIDPHLIGHASRALQAIRWDDGVVADFMGKYLSEPKQHVYFNPPDHPLARGAFTRKLRSATIRLDRRSRMLSHGLRFYLNGALFKVARANASALQQLADRREIAGSRLARPPIADLVFDWYRQGFVLLETGP
jgi:50S ribosomal protein L16 3-hydroxylase